MLKMKKKLTFLVLCTIIETIVFSQNIDSLKVFLTKYQKVIFVTPDSEYKFTRFIAPNGKFYFQEGFVDSGNYCSGLFYGHSTFITPAGNYSLLCENSPRFIDTINCYLPVLEIGPNDDSIVNLVDELTYSYIMKNIGESDITKLEKFSLRILYPCDYFGFSTFYKVIKIQFNLDSVRLYSYSVQSFDHNGIQLIRQDSCLLKKRDVGNITKDLKKIKPVEDITCRRPGNPWFLEYNDGTKYNSYIISDYCLLGQKKLRPVANLCYLILRMDNKYFDTDCSISP
jgi:hypothetical protein